LSLAKRLIETNTDIAITSPDYSCDNFYAAATQQQS
jgi:hypothetical protein